MSIPRRKRQRPGKSSRSSIATYAGGDIVLPGDPSKVLRVADNPELADMNGKTLITTDGTTLLGADDKAGVAVIMEAAAHLMAHPEIPHGPIRICFTCDEEIGHGVDHVDLKKLGAARRLHARRRRRGRDRRRDLLRRPGRRDDHRRQHPSRHRQGPHGQRGAPGRRCSSTACRGRRCRRRRPPTARASCTPTASRAASPR